MHEMHIYYIFITQTDHRSNDFQDSRVENVMNDGLEVFNKCIVPVGGPIKRVPFIKHFTGSQVQSADGPHF